MSHEDAPRNGNGKKTMDRAVTDSVHERFRPIHVRCETCRVDIIGNHVSIEKHFNNNHPSSRQCCYCKGKVFTYRKVHDGGYDNENSQEFVYHKCHGSQRE